MSLASVCDIEKKHYSRPITIERSGSLLDLLKVAAEAFIQFGRVFQYWMSRDSDDPLLLPGMTSDDFSDYNEALESLQRLCATVGLSVSEILVRNALKETLPTLSYKDGAAKMGELQRCVQAELESKYFFYISAERAKYLVLYDVDKKSDEAGPELSEVGTEILRFLPCIKTFPSTVFDLEEAGNCFATGVFTACVFHLMRMCEYGLVSLARSIGADPSISSWEAILRKIASKIQEMDKTHPVGWENDKAFYSESAALMLNVKNSWRNSVSHIRRNYDEPRARRIFNSVEALMIHLAGRLKETEMPAESPLATPDEEGPSDVLPSPK
jgi:hypothetical protein